jgi:hypothetical protein
MGSVSIHQRVVSTPFGSPFVQKNTESGSWSAKLDIAGEFRSTISGLYRSFSYTLLHGKEVLLRHPFWEFCVLGIQVIFVD